MDPMSPPRPYVDAAGKTLAEYPRPSVAVDTALLTVPEGSDALHLLLIRRAGTHRKGAWALPGTFVHEGETLADAVLRSLQDKAGVEGLSPRQLHVFDDPRRDDRGWVLSVAHLDVVAWPRIAAAVSDREDVRLELADQVNGLPFDHDAIVAMAVHEIRARYREHPDPDRLLPSPFTLFELRQLHEAVLGESLLKDTFRRHMQSQLRATTRYRQGTVGKPAMLFRHPRSGRGS
jgi:8-oxo-dGTP diphosphatase